MTCRHACVALAALSLLGVPAFGQNGEVQDEHDKQVRADTKRNTEYHNNADDYPNGSYVATPLIKIPPKAKPEVHEPTITPEMRARWDSYDKVVASFRAGDPDAGLLLGSYQYKGELGWPNHVEAFKTWMQVADRNVSARFLAGRLLYLGDGTAANEDQGWAMMTSAATAGNAEAKAYLAANPRVAKTEHFPSMLTRVAEEADGVTHPDHPYPKLDKRARALIAGKLKDPQGKDYLDAAMLYANGNAMPTNSAKAREFALKAVELGLSEYTIGGARGILMDYAFVHREQDPGAFRAAVEAFAAVSDDTHSKKDAQYMQAAVACMDHDFAQERFLLGEAVKTIPYDLSAKPPVVAWVDLGLMQLSGEGGPVDETSGMANLLAVKNNPEAAYYIARFVATGTHLQPKNPDLAREFMQIAAKGGQPDAVRELAANAGTQLK